MWTKELKVKNSELSHNFMKFIHIFYEPKWVNYDKTFFRKIFRKLSAIYVQI